MLPDKWIGYGSLLAAVALFSTVEVASKAVGAQIDPFLFTFLRFSVTGLVLLALARPLVRLRPRRLRFRDYGVFMLNGLVGVALSISLFHWAILTFEKAASAAVVFSINPLFVLVLARFINHEAWEPRKWAAALLGGAGVVCFAWESGRITADAIWGLVLMLCAAGFFALSICIAKRVMPDYGAILLMGASALCGSLLLLPLVVLRVAPAEWAALRQAWVLVAYVCLFGTAAAYALYYFGLLNTSANSGSMMFFLKPVLASGLSAWLLKETLNWYMLAGTGLILLGLLLAVCRRR